MTSSSPVIVLEDVGRKFETRTETIVAVDSVTAAISEGEFICLYGASGSGKSTLLNLIAGLDVADHGDVQVAGTSLAGLTDDQRADLRLTTVGVVFQDDNLVGEFSAGENVMLPLLVRGFSREQAQATSRSALDALGVGELFDRMPIDMSGGQRQRVGIARAFVGDRKILLADEPTGALDSENSEALFSELQRLCKHVGLTAVVATHDPLARRFASKVWSIRDGRLGEQ
jgi:putative ABC transport system ATP-binding protein